MILECRSLKNADLDHSFHDIYVEFVKNEKQIGEIRKQQEEFAAQVEALKAEGQNIKCKIINVTFKKIVQKICKIFNIFSGKIIMNPLKIMN